MDIKAKKISFIKQLNQLGIHLQEINTSAYLYPEYIIEDTTSIPHLTSNLKEKGRSFNNDDYEYFSGIFTKINYFRNRQNDRSFDKIGHIFLTSKWFAIWLANHPSVRTNDSHIPFAAAIEHLTSRFWFKLCKGFGDSTSLPKSLEVITRAQVILSSQLNNSVSKAYDDLQAAFKTEKHDKEWFLEMSHQLRNKAKLPEEIDDTTVDDSLDFILEENYIEKFHKDSVLKDHEFAELKLHNDDLQNEVNRLQSVELRRQQQYIQAEIIKQRAAFLLWKGKEHKKIVNSEIYYFVKTGLFLFFVLLFIAVSKMKTIAQFLEDYKMGIGTDIALIVLAILCANELFMRTFILDKEKVKRGRTQFILIFAPKKKSRLLQTKVDEWVSDFDKNQAA